MNRRLLVTWVVVVLTALTWSLLHGGPATADQRKLTLSPDAAGPFGDHLADPLFTGTFVPGAVTSTFFVRNNFPQTARVTIALVPKVPVNDLERALSFSAGVAGSSGTPVPLSEGRKKNECRTLVTGPTVSGGAVQQVDVTMHVGDGAPMDQDAAFSFVVTLSQVSNKGKVDVCGAQSPGGATSTATLAGTSLVASHTTVPIVETTPVSARRQLVSALGAASLVFLLVLFFLTARSRRLE